MENSAAPLGRRFKKPYVMSLMGISSTRFSRLFHDDIDPDDTVPEKSLLEALRSGYLDHEQSIAALRKLGYSGVEQAQEALNPRPKPGPAPQPARTIDTVVAETGTKGTWPIDGGLTEEKSMSVLGYKTRAQYYDFRSRWYSILQNNQLSPRLAIQIMLRGNYATEFKSGVVGRLGFNSLKLAAAAIKEENPHREPEKDLARPQQKQPKKPPYINLSQNLMQRYKYKVPLEDAMAELGGVFEQHKFFVGQALPGGVYCKDKSQPYSLVLPTEVYAKMPQNPRDVTGVDIVDAMLRFTDAQLKEKYAGWVSQFIGKDRLR